uniref:Membrane insertase YidC/Oxa/ALB C-terminal domain-containing protein n=1 Tax=Leersia perrieri TaxID=77586 RepID=A0A0D9UWS2_9ORYZ
MAKALLSSSLLPSLRLPLSPTLPSLLRRHAVGRRRAAAGCRVRASLHDGIDSIGGLHAALERAEAALYTLADAAVVAADAAAGGGGDAGAAAAQKSGGWFGFISEALEVVLKVLKDGLSAVHVPYAYGFAIILLTVIVKAATLPLTKQQVESTLAMQNLQPQLKAIQQRYAGNQERIQLETARLYKQAGVNPLAGCFPTLATIPVWIGLYQALSNVANEGLLTEGFFWIPSLGGPTTIAARQSGAGISWLLPFVFVSMEIMKPPQTDDPSQKNTLLVLKFLPFMIGWFSLSVPSGLSIYWFTNNVLSTAQQVWLRKLGGAKPVVSQGGSGIITAGRAKRTSAQPGQPGERFRQLKEEESKKKGNKALASGDSDPSASTSDDEESDDDTTEEVNSVDQYGCVVDLGHNFDDQLGSLIFKCRTDTKRSGGTGVLLAHSKMKIVQYTTIGLRG